VRHGDHQQRDAQGGGDDEVAATALVAALDKAGYGSQLSAAA
jgi:phage replication-related protein YjqB (UPF0714/DUF867 family)